MKSQHFHSGQVVGDRGQHGFKGSSSVRPRYTLSPTRALSLLLTDRYLDAFNY